jgi:hypothetical protein
MKMILFIALITTTFSITVQAKSCPENSGKYGDGIQYQDMFCRFFILADKKNADTSRNVTVTDEGLIQVFSNFPGTTNSNSTGARVYYLFPIRTDKSLVANEKSLSMTHPSGAVINFDKSGKLSSSDLNLKVSSEINSSNKSGVEILSYPKGLVFDLGYRMGNTPTLNPNANVTITDKNLKKCSLINSDINKIKKDNVELKYKTNLSLHQFLVKKCPALDLTDLLSAAIPATMQDTLKISSNPQAMGRAPAMDAKSSIDDSRRDRNKQKSTADLDAFIDNLEANGKAR